MRFLAALAAHHRHRKASLGGPHICLYFLHQLLDIGLLRVDTGFDNLTHISKNVQQMLDFFDRLGYTL